MSRRRRVPDEELCDGTGMYAKDAGVVPRWGGEVWCPRCGRKVHQTQAHFLPSHRPLSKKGGQRRVPG